MDGRILRCKDQLQKDCHTLQPASIDMVLFWPLYGSSMLSWQIKANRNNNGIELYVCLEHWGIFSSL